MTLRRSPLHFNPLRPSRNHLSPVSWPEEPTQTSTDSSPFAYLHEPYVADGSQETVTLEAMGRYDRETQRWVFPGDGHTMGVYTKTRDATSKSPPTASPGESPDYDYHTDDACQ